MVWDPGFGVSNLGVGVWGFGLGVQGLALEACGSRHVF
jgi:hypothetical protein